MALDITVLHNVTSEAVKEAAAAAPTNRTDTCVDKDKSFHSLLSTAVDNINTTNVYLSNAEDEEIKWALGETENTHDLTIALQKASTALQYTVALRDRLLEAYRELMQMQV